MGEAMFCDHEGQVIESGGGRSDEIICSEIRPDLIREARLNWGVENNIYQLWHRGYVAVKGGAQDCPYSFMKDMVNGTFELPWEADVIHKDGSACGFEPPSRSYIGEQTNMRVK
jgi:formamidase